MEAPPRRLPAHHIPRQRLTDRCRHERLVIVEAAAGYGKSVLGAELVNAWGVVPIEVLLEEGGVSARLLASRLGTAVARAGFVDAAGAMAAVGDDAAGAVDAMMAALASESCAFVVDDAHHAERDAAALIDRMASRLQGRQQLVVLSRHLPAGAQRLRRADGLHLGAADLAIRSEETRQLCESGFGLAVSDEDCRLLDLATGGWTAAAVLAASRSKRTGLPLREVAGIDAPGTPGFNAVALILDELIVALGTQSGSLARLARLPLLDSDVVALVMEDEGFFERSIDLGLPVSPAGAGWWTMPGPVRDHLDTLGSQQPEALGRAAAYYERRGQLGIALEMLLGAGDFEAAALLLGGADPRRTEAIDALELLAVIGRIPDEVLHRHPRALFQVARACGVAAFLQPRSKLLGQLDPIVDGRSDAVLRRAVDVELAVDLVNQARHVEALALARSVFESATAAEQLTRARALTVMGQARCFIRGDDGEVSDAILGEAAGYLEQATNTYLAMGYGEALAGPAIDRAIRTEFGRGNANAALEVLDGVLAHVAGSPRRRGMILYYRAQVLTELGRHDESEASLAEVARIGERHRGGTLSAFVHWERMLLASYRGDATATLHHANEMEAQRGDWWSAAGAAFLAEAADCLDRVGLTVEAWERLERAMSDPQDAERVIAMAEGALLGRHGDPVLAEERLAIVHHRGIYPRERWRASLLRAYAAWRRGDAAAGPLAAKAFAEAARVGQPLLPLVRERDVAESLLALAIETGSRAAADLEVASLPVCLGLLGRFELTRGGRPVALGPGQASQLLKLVAVGGGTVTSEQAIERLWPEVDPAAGRNRLRTVLSRLKEVAPETIERDGELLVLGEGVRVDLAQFHAEARRSLALRPADMGAALALARSAIARYRGELLPGDPYEPWAEEPRETARRTMLDLLDLCATAAADSGDLDDARRMVERSLEIAPFEDHRYIRVAQILYDQGRPGAALSVLRRARAVLAPLGIDVPLTLPGRKTTAAA